MNRWKRWKRTLKRQWQLLRHPFERQLKAAIRLGEIRQKKKSEVIYVEKPVYIPMTPDNSAVVYIDPIMRAQAQAQIGAYEPPEKQTDPFATAHQRLQHRRALMRHNTTSLAHKIQLTANEPETVQLPTVPQPRKLHFQRLYAEPDSPFNAL